MSGPRPGLVLVSPCSAGPAAVPSRVIVCGGCGADCWLSEYSGASTLALAQMVSESGEVLILCSDCLVASAHALGRLNAEFHGQHNSGDDL